MQPEICLCFAASKNFYLPIKTFSDTLRGVNAHGYFSPARMRCPVENPEEAIAVADPRKARSRLRTKLRSVSLSMLVG